MNCESLKYWEYKHREIYWPLHVGEQNQTTFQKQPHKDGSWVGMWSIHIYWSSLALVLTYPFLLACLVFFFFVFFLCAFDKGLIFDQITKVSFLNELLYLDLLSINLLLNYSIIFFSKLSHWSCTVLGAVCSYHALLRLPENHSAQKTVWLMKLMLAGFTLEWVRKTDFMICNFKNVNSVHTY